MSQAPRCDLHPELDADFIIGIAATGEQMFLCAGDAARFGLDLAKATLDPGEIEAAMAPADAPASPNGQEGAPTTGRRKRSSKATSVKRPRRSAAEGVAQTPPAADDR